MELSPWKLMDAKQNEFEVKVCYNMDMHVHYMRDAMRFGTRDDEVTN